jgi:prepilin-type N-terminal cleavage/methylation domain-containing protein
MKKIITTISQKQQSGFTLLETLFAVIIFSFALVSLIGITGKGVSATVSAKQQLTAEFLAEELLEVARNTRDGNFQSGTTPWTTGISQCTEQSPCDIDYGNTNYLSLVSQNGANELYENDGSFRPVDQLPGGLPSGFSRGLVFTDLGNNQGKLTATVTWQQKTLTRKFQISTYISDWYTAAPDPNAS